MSAPGLTTQQVDALLHPIAGARVQQTKNSQGRTASNVEAYDIRRRLTNIFGFGGWSGEVLSMDLIGEHPTMVGDKKDREGVTVGYRCLYRLTIHATGAVYTESATGDGTMGLASRWDAHDFAVKTAESQALKRCAINLGDQFGLSLYNKGSLAPLVVYVLGDDPAKWTPDGVIRPEKPKDGQQQQVDVTDHVTEQLAPEDGPAPEPDQEQQQAAEKAAEQPPAGETTAPPAGEPAPQEVIRDKVLAAKNRAELVRLQVEAHNAGVLGATVADGEGEALSLEALIQRRVRGLRKTEKATS